MIVVSPDTLSLLRFLGIVPLAAAILALFLFKNSGQQGKILIAAWAVWAVYMAGVWLLVSPAA